jgi:hypothetical protein
MVMQDGQPVGGARQQVAEAAPVASQEGPFTVEVAPEPMAEPDGGWQAALEIERAKNAKLENDLKSRRVQGMRQEDMVTTLQDLSNKVGVLREGQRAFIDAFVTDDRESLPQKMANIETQVVSNQAQGRHQQAVERLTTQLNAALKDDDGNNLYGDVNTEPELEEARDRWLAGFGADGAQADIATLSEAVGMVRDFKSRKLAVGAGKAATDAKKTQQTANRAARTLDLESGGRGGVSVDDKGLREAFMDNPGDPQIRQQYLEWRTKQGL